MAEDTKKTNVEGDEDQDDILDNDTQDSGSSTDNDSSKGKDSSSGSDKKTEKTFTQDQVTKMMAKEKNQGRNAAFKELGINPKDSKAIASFKAYIESQKTDDQKAAEKQAEEQEKINEANDRAATAEAKAEAMMLGAKPQFVDDIIVLAKAKFTEGSDFKTIIGELKTKYPAWFGTDDSDDKGDDSGDNKAGKKGTGSSMKSVDKKGKDSETKGLGARLAAQRKSSAKKSSYWGK